MVLLSVAILKMSYKISLVYEMFNENVFCFCGLLFVCFGFVFDYLLMNRPSLTSTVL